jgi:hypothetical protein
VQLAALRVPHERADVRVDLSDEAAVAARDVESPDLERERPLGVGIEDDGGRLVRTGLRLLGTLGPLRVVDRARALAEAEDLRLVVRLVEREVDLRDPRSTCAIFAGSPEPSSGCVQTQPSLT